MTAANPTWLLVDTYIDITSSKTGSHRKEFNRLLTKSISRFDRDSLEILSALEQLRATNTRVIFEMEEIDAGATIEDEYNIFTAIRNTDGQKEIIQCGMGAARDFLQIIDHLGLSLFNPLKGENVTSMQMLEALGV